ncbi:hypothetical protein BS78_09G140300 [Paspalum vaginatum]|nr:hypothetical protein BS78_09G140300 [Paspalum vaginatum]
MEVAAGKDQDDERQLVRQLQFAPGYRFVPSEQDLVNVYLRGKIEGWKNNNLALNNVVNEVAILEWQPGALVEKYKAYGTDKWYFFTIREPSSSNKVKEPDRKVRVPGVTAAWKATGRVSAIHAKPKELGEPIDDMSKDGVIGTKRVLIYHSSDAEEHRKWSMHEYILKGHDAIGQYALCSIQLKQHSDTKLEASAAVELQHQEATTTPTEVALKRPRRKTKRQNQKTIFTDRKKKPSMQAEGQMQEEEEGISPDRPVELPVTPWNQDLGALQQEQQPLVPYGALPVIPAAPLQEYPSHPGGNHQPGASASMHQGDAHAYSFQCQDVYHQFPMQGPQMLHNRDEQPLGFTASEFFISPVTGSNVDHVGLIQQQEDHDLFGVHSQHLYTEGQYLNQNSNLFMGNTTWRSSSREHDHHQIYQHENEGAFGAQVKNTDAQYYDQSIEQGVYGTSGQIGYGSSDQFTKGDDNSADGSFDTESFFPDISYDDPHQDLVSAHRRGEQSSSLAANMSSSDHVHDSNMLPMGEPSSYTDVVSNHATCTGSWWC